jgi:hypothetical protein
MSSVDAAHTRVADMPGYPTKKLVLGRPDTRTNALIFSISLRLSCHHRGSLFPPEAGPWICALSRRGSQYQQDAEGP